MVTGTVLGAVSWGYKHREVFKKAWNGVKSGVKKLGDWLGWD